MNDMKETRWFLSALLLLFIALKLTGHITWSWWWVLAPFWGGIAVAALAGLLYIGSAVVAGLWERRKREST